MTITKIPTFTPFKVTLLINRFFLYSLAFHTDHYLQMKSKVIVFGKKKFVMKNNENKKNTNKFGYFSCFKK